MTDGNDHNFTAVPGLIDSHAHVWDRSCQVVPDARYRPGYEATIDTYLGVLDTHGIARAVLVQPSFLGSDNTYLLRCLRAHPDRLRAIVVLEPDATETEIDDLTAAGVIGLRYNLLSMQKQILETPAYRDLTARVATRDWWIEVQARGKDWPTILPLLRDARLMIDHFGKPSEKTCTGLDALLTRDPETTCAKLSAPYRQNSIDLRTIARQLIAHFGAENCPWGSDWPWTQHEGQHGFADTIRWLDDWATPTQRSTMIASVPKLLRF